MKLTTTTKWIKHWPKLYDSTLYNFKPSLSKSPISKKARQQWCTMQNNGWSNWLGIQLVTKMSQIWFLKVCVPQDCYLTGVRWHSRQVLLLTKLGTGTLRPEIGTKNIQWCNISNSPFRTFIRFPGCSNVCCLTINNSKTNKRLFAKQTSQQN